MGGIRLAGRRPVSALPVGSDAGLSGPPAACAATILRGLKSPAFATAAMAGLPLFAEARKF